MDKILAEVSIGAFLHDVGKVSDRAKIRISEQSERMKQQVCPTKGGKSTHLHAIHTSDFFERSRIPVPKGVDRATVARLASCHHRPSDSLDFIIQQADWISAGQDRGDTEQGRNMHLQSIFASLFDSNDATASGYSLIPQTLDKNVFPCEISVDDIPTQYGELFNRFVGSLDVLDGQQVNIYIEQLRWLASLHFWPVPSSQTHSADISLLDHSLTTAAVAAALYQYHSQTNTLTEQAVCNKSEKKFRLVTGDLSGIQDYIFHDTLQDQKGASKRLRARSFYLGLLTDYVSRWILRQLGLSAFNILLDAGGKFTLLVGNTQQNIKILDTLEGKLSEWFYRQYQGLLNLNLSCDTELSPADLMREHIGDAMRQSALSIERRKKQSFRECLVNETGWRTERFTHGVAVKKHEAKEKEFFEELGGRLPKARCVLMGPEGAMPPGILDPRFEKIDYMWPLGYSGINLSDNLPNPRQELLDYYELVPGQSCKGLNKVAKGQFLATYVPRDEKGQISTFKDLAGRSKGYPMLGVLKADLDRLGLIFSQGLGKNNSLGRLAMLSRQIDFFFRGFLPGQMVSPPDGHDNFKDIYCVFAGGDDLLLVGPWSTILDFAVFLNESFHQYTCFNPKLTLSAAVAVIPPDAPLARAALQAEAMLEQAKNAGRNRIVIFGEVMTWDLYAKAIDDGRFLSEAMSDAGKDGIRLNKGFVYRLLNYYKMASDETKMKNMIWRSHLAYDIARNVAQPKIKDKTGETPGLQRIKEMTLLRMQHKDEIKRLKIAATYCLYLNRKKGD